jgi:polyhydroxyalkanoate synthase
MYQFLQNYTSQILKYQAAYISLLKNIGSGLDFSVGTTPYEVVFTKNKMTLRYYKPEKAKYKTPIVMIYALVNRPYMLDLQPDRSIIRHLKESGFEIYLIDWGYPSTLDRYITLDDYICDYIDGVIDFVKERTGRDKVSIVSICQGGTFSVIYTSLFQEKVKNLVTMVAPIDFDTRDGLLHIWAKALLPERMVEVFGNIPGEFMNIGFLLLNPIRLMYDKYINLFDIADEPNLLSNFIRMEKWIFDSPDQVATTWCRFIKEFYLNNGLVKGEIEIQGRKVNLKNIKVPVLNIYAEKDHLVPPASSKPLCDLISSKDKETFSLPTGHIGLFVSSKSKDVLYPHLEKWLAFRD